MSGRRIEDQARVCVLALYELLDGDATVAGCLGELEDALRAEVGNAALADQVSAHGPPPPGPTGYRPRRGVRAPDLVRDWGGVRALVIGGIE